MSSFRDHKKEQLPSFLQQHFAVTINPIRSTSFPYCTEHLFDPAWLRQIIQEQALQLGEPEQKVVGTLFAKRYSVLIMGVVTAISLFDIPLKLQPRALRFRITDGGAMQYEAEMEESVMFSSGATEKRQIAFSDYAACLLEQVGQVLHTVSSYTGANEKVMWSLVSHNLHNLYGRLETESSLREAGERKQMISQDYKVLFETGNPAHLSKKTIRYEHPKLGEQPFYVRPYCCLAYKTRHVSETLNYCSTCPKLSSEDRWRILDSCL